jgi:hypothetical protein
VSLKRRQRFAKYEHVLLRCGDDIRSLQRFVNAQVVAFRKILKKYRKWTGSSTLGSRFKDNVLSHPKSFTRRDFSQLQSLYDDLLQTLQAATPAATPAEWSGDGSNAAEPVHSPRPSEQISPSETLVVPESQQFAGGYWNEYDCGSEAGDFNRDADVEYAIYVDPNEEVGFPGMKTLRGLFTTPARKLHAWMSGRHPDDECGPLLPAHARRSTYGATTRSVEPSYFSIPPGSAGPAGAASPLVADTDAEDESSWHRPSNRHSRRGSYNNNNGYASSSEEGGGAIFFPAGYRAHYAAALPSVEEQRIAHYRERVLFWGAWACYAVAFVLTGIAAVLVVAGRNKMRLEVDAGVTLGIMTSLGLACAALSMACSRRWGRQSLLGRLAVWTTFAVVCVGDGALLVLLMGNTRL